MPVSADFDAQTPMTDVLVGQGAFDTRSGPLVTVSSSFCALTPSPPGSQTSAVALPHVPDVASRPKLRCGVAAPPSGSLRVTSQAGWWRRTDVKTEVYTHRRSAQMYSQTSLASYMYLKTNFDIIIKKHYIRPARLVSKLGDATAAHSLGPAVRGRCDRARGTFTRVHASWISTRRPTSRENARASFRLFLLFLSPGGARRVRMRFLLSRG